MQGSDVKILHEEKRITYSTSTQLQEAAKGQNAGLYGGGVHVNILIHTLLRVCP